MQIVISGGESSVNNTVEASISEVTLFVSGMASGRAYDIAIAAINQEGHGPFSKPVEIVVDSAMFQPLDDDEDRILNSNVRQERMRRMTYIMAAVATVCFFLLATLMLVAYRRRMFSCEGSSNRKPLGYLEASTEDYHRQLPARPIIKEGANSGRNLWIESGRDFEEEKESNSSEKKLLSPHSNSNSDSEYTYVEHHKHMFNNNRSHNRQGNESPEPYATTDIFRQDCYDGYLRPDNHRMRLYPSSERRQPLHHYAAASVVSNGQHSKRCCPSKKEAMSCDDLSRRSSGRMSGKTNRSASSSRVSNKSNKVPQSSLLDMLPPPPSHPPPPPQESVISPRYLFQHPAYQSTQKQLASSKSLNNHYHKPSSSSSSSSSQYQQHRVRPSELKRSGSHYQSEDVFTRLLPQQQQHYQVVGSHEQVPNLEKDLENELQIFNDAVTKFSNDLKCQDAIEESLSCDADEEDEEE